MVLESVFGMMRIVTTPFEGHDNGVAKKMVLQEFGVIDIINVVVEDNKPPL